jgi:hypothetical protein
VETPSLQTAHTQIGALTSRRSYAAGDKDSAVVVSTEHREDTKGRARTVVSSAAAKQKVDIDNKISEIGAGKGF